MNSYQTFFLIAGVAVCAYVMMQTGFWAAQSLTMMGRARREFERSRDLFNQRIDSILEIPGGKTSENAGGEQGHRWTGYRTFIVSKVVPEAKDVVSVYLKPDDGKQIASFTPGQHLTIKVPVPGQAKPVVRCYSLSSAPDQEQYRISVKALTTPIRGASPDQSSDSQFHFGLASHFINKALHAGDRIEVKAPAGHFVLDETSDQPVIMLAGGIGITPMISMMEQLRRTNPKRMAVLIYGVRNSAEMAFADRIRQLTAGESNAHAIRCFSRPLTEDVSDGSFEVQGHVTIDLLKQVLPDNQCQFYLCGAPAFMQSLYEGLVQWEVPETQIFFEAFGPASVNRKKQTEVQTSDSISAKYEQLDPVTFSVADKTVLWSANHESLLELAEAHDIFPDSGCRAGSCGSCETALIRGKVAYPEGQSVDCPAGACLICVAKPDGPVELEL